ncbi:MAG TPA: aminotransferase class I/II-fold pyridoxal phosphate-dependent enzyme [Pseudolabrys sp.]|nr:aminotransferase class I/II-fold pyridoxal phosphate-dependent enzyme [Pseudolabrys sp.]
MRKNTVADLAIFGGPRLFTTPKPVGQLDAPPVEDYLALLRIPYDARYLSNDGPLVRRLEDKLCEYHGVRHCLAVANAALGLTMLMQLFGQGKQGEVIMPAFSYRGLPHFAQWAGQMPKFCDVDPVTQGLDPAAVESCISEKTTSILVVCNFNSPGLIDELCAVGARHNIPVILDSVYGLGSSYKGKLLGGFAHAEVFSTHATKLLNGFEGGYITTNDDDLAAMLRWQRTFCLHGLRPPAADKWPHGLGLNAKLNELHAAMALACLERLGGVIERNKARYEGYKAAIAGIPGLSLMPYLEDKTEKRNYEMAVLDVDKSWPLTRDQILALLKAEGAAISPYYSPPLHKSPHSPAGMTPPDLPVSESLATRFVQLPVGEMVTLDDVAAVGAFLKFLHGHGAEISPRMRKAA